MLGATHPTQAPISIRRKPRREGRPGWIRVDSVRQGDLDNVKGVYHINAVNEVIEYQFTGCVERISENFLLPVLERLLESFHFVVEGFHSDRGSKYVNYQVDALLEKLHVAEFTKSRLRRSNLNLQIGSLAGTPCREARCPAKGPCGTMCADPPDCGSPATTAPARSCSAAASMSR